MKLVNLDNEEVIVESLRGAYHFFTRLRGLMFTDKLDSGSGLHIRPCRSIHTYFMNYPIDVLYLNKDNVIVAVEEKLEPGRTGKRYADAYSVVELPAGTLMKTGTDIGHRLIFQPSHSNVGVPEGSILEKTKI
ncbi:DUF192 domain-containing protein [Halobacillus yeomjeoni]|uniref:DUF192 domain-containing protein n=1 Tax=Halobacillus yeomjeoni TaxID=311194 RepID=A0A931MTT9_9BACI|nr:DUF192 domain-containing protein [Halobacillus yeomjeoni]MBH0229183.1 DUF192 domain-containing protein [Halobacillus yeomjeoni]MCA0983419.1 DUF192 domain-containing protein [Halobacillus yeomjeoni]